MAKKEIRHGPDKNDAEGPPQISLPHLRRFAPSAKPSSDEDDPATICGDVLDAARAESGEMAVATPAPSREGLLRVEAMLGVISYCYVKGIFDSGEIERKMWEDGEFLATFGSDFPTAQRIRNFRRVHRTAIRATIENAIHRFVQRTLASPGSAVIGTIPSGAEHLLEMASIMDQLSSEES